MTSRLPPPLPSGARLGVLGGGQLGAFFVRAAQNLGFKTAVFCPEAESPALQCTDMSFCAAYDDEEALSAFAQACSAITTEFENVPEKTIHWLSQQTRVAPCASAVAIAQHRLREKSFFQTLGLSVPQYFPIHHNDDWTRLTQGDASFFPAIFKTCSLGYDGKGQWEVHSPEQAREIWQTHGRFEGILEKKQTLLSEISVIAVRDGAGNIKTYPPSTNRHVGGILARTIAPAMGLSPALSAQALDWAEKIVSALHYVGVMGIEFFVTAEGLMVNEIAPRPHNSGHYTLSACPHSQFEQQVRTLANLPLAPTTIQRQALMLNILGDAWEVCAGEPPWSLIWQHLTADLDAHLYLYGKREARSGRKMGHLTLTLPLHTASAESLLMSQAHRLAQNLGIAESFVTC